MFLVDDLLKTLIEYFKEIIISGRERNAEAIKQSRIALRKLAGSLEEIECELTSSLHQLRRASASQTQFREALMDMVNHDKLVSACNESGVCKDLRIAADELSKLGKDSSRGSQAALKLAQEIEIEYENNFVYAVQEFLGSARGYDIIGATQDKHLDTEKIVEELDKRIKDMKSIRSELENTLSLFRSNVTK